MMMMMMMLHKPRARGDHRRRRRRLLQPVVGARIVCRELTKNKEHAPRGKAPLNYIPNIRPVSRSFQSAAAITVSLLGAKRALKQRRPLCSRGRPMLAGVARAT